ncbi:MAG: hypothetical protein ACOZBL_03705, partial [Patescibacteria group bacterium]
LVIVKVIALVKGFFHQFNIILSSIIFPFFNISIIQLIYLPTLSQYLITLPIAIISYSSSESES